MTKKAAFLSPLEVEAITDSRWRLLAPLIYDSALIGIVTAPKSFITDFASVPRVPFIFDVLGDIAHRSAVIHDYLYSTGQVNRYVADKVLLEAMKLDGIPLWKRYQIFIGVRIGGWKAWREHRSHSID